jgi:hypothetical protein
MNDTFKGKELGRKMSALFASIAVAVPTTTAIAGFIQVHFDWPSIFWAFILYCVGILFVGDLLTTYFLLS